MPAEAAGELPAVQPELTTEPGLPLDLPPAASGPADDIPAPADYAARRYLEYAMSVVTGRALPSAADGQKPVQRRILYAMHRMGLYKSPRHVKSARAVGDVIGKYHPHGDSSVYDAMVRMAQDWSLRYPIVDGQGNFGLRDGDNAAAMRYTEARLTPIAELLLAEIDEGTGSTGSPTTMAPTTNPPCSRPACPFACSTAPPASPSTWRPKSRPTTCALGDLLAPLGVPLVINDRIDVALACGAQGVHLGQSDMPVEQARRWLPAQVFIGWSVETPDDVRRAARSPVDYLGVSPVFATPTKIDTAPPWGLAGLRQARALTNLPLVAIGGIHSGNAADVLAAGAQGLAVVSAICSADDPFAAAQKLRQFF